MSYRLEIELTGLPKGPNCGHQHWTRVNAERRKWRLMVGWMVATKKPPTPLTACRITCTRHSSQPMDFDNLAMSFKPLIDGLVESGIIKDDNQGVILDRKYLCQTAAPKAGRVSIVVEEITI